jgi:hypothetical protein
LAGAWGETDAEINELPLREPGRSQREGNAGIHDAAAITIDRKPASRGRRS